MPAGLRRGASQPPAPPLGDAALPLLLNALVGVDAGARLRARRLPRHPRARDPRGRARSCSPTSRSSSHLVIATRAEPPVDVSRLRARGRARRGAERAAALQRRGGGGAAQRHALAGAARGEQLELLQRQDRGLGGRALPGRPLAARPPGAARCADDLGYDRHLVDYLGDEVLSAQTPQARAFLLDTCVLDRFMRAAVRRACAATTGRSALLSEIERANLFLVPLDERREWFRYHHVFREVLRRELAGAPARPRHRRAARPRRRLVRRARATSRRADHATCSRPARRGAAADLDRRVTGTRGCRRGRSATVAALARRAAGEDVVDGDPRLCLARAWLALDSGEHAAAERWADATAAADDGRPLLEGGADVASSVAMLRATLAYRAGDLAAAETRRRAGGRARGRSGSAWRAVALATLGAARLLPRRPVGRGRAAARAGGRRPRRPAPTAWPCCARRGRSRRSRCGSGDSPTRAAGSPPPTPCARASRSRSTGWGRWRPPSPASSRPTRASSSAAPRAPASARSSSPGAAPRGRSSIYALAALAPVQATLGDAGRRRRDAAQRAASRCASRRAPASSRTSSTTRSAGCAARPAPTRGRAGRRALRRARCRCSGCSASELSIARDRRRALRLAQHRQDPRAQDLPQARRRHARGGGRPGARASPAARSRRGPLCAA